jgi:hypothetical protein
VEVAVFSDVLGEMGFTQKPVMINEDSNVCISMATSDTIFGYPQGAESQVPLAARARPSGGAGAAQGGHDGVKRVYQVRVLIKDEARHGDVRRSSGRGPSPPRDSEALYRISGILLQVRV